MTTLYTIGSLRVEVWPFNVHEVSESSSADFAVKDVVGSEPPLEFVGVGGNEMSLSGRLFPHELDGLDELETLKKMQASGKPQYIMRGDGKPLGWWAILSVQHRSSYLDKNGVGRVVEVSISLRRASKPASTSFFSLMANLI